MDREKVISFSEFEKHVTGKTSLAEYEKFDIYKLIKAQHDRINSIAEKTNKLSGIEDQRYEDEYKKRRASFIEAAKPLVDWIQENGCPHDTIVVTQTNAEFMCGEIAKSFKSRD